MLTLISSYSRPDRICVDSYLQCDDPLEYGYLSTIYRNLYGDVVLPFIGIDIVNYLGSLHIDKLNASSALMMGLKPVPKSRHQFLWKRGHYDAWVDIVNGFEGLLRQEFIRTPNANEHDVFHRSIIGKLSLERHGAVKYRPSLYTNDEPLNNELSKRHCSFDVLGDEIIHTVSYSDDLVGSMTGNYGLDLQEIITSGNVDYVPGYYTRYIVDHATFTRNENQIFLAFSYIIAKTRKYGSRKTWTIDPHSFGVTLSIEYYTTNKVSNISILDIAQITPIVYTQSHLNDPLTHTFDVVPTRGQLLEVAGIVDGSSSLVFEDGSIRGDIQCVINEPYFWGPWSAVQDGSSEQFINDLGYYRASGKYYPKLGQFMSVTRNMQNAIPYCKHGCAVSAQDAINTGIGKLTQVWQTLIEIREICKPLEVKDLILAFLSNRNNRTLKDFAKMIATIDIAWAFGVKPTVEAVEEFRTNFLKVVQKLYSRRLFKTQTAYGKRVFKNVTLPKYLGSSIRCDVECRTTLRFRLIEDNIWGQLAPLHVLGTIPNLKNIYDVLPWTWLTNYIFDVSSAVSYVDTYVESMFLDIEYSVNSIKIKKPIDVTPYGITTIEEPFMTTYYRFQVPQGIPVMGPGALPVVRIMSGLPKLHILGSLGILRIM